MILKGPIVRISPDELHCNDPGFINTIYAAGSQKRDKYSFLTGQFGLVLRTVNDVYSDP